jgi:hypothetical protein
MIKEIEVEEIKVEDIEEVKKVEMLTLSDLLMETLIVDVPIQYTNIHNDGAMLDPVLGPRVKQGKRGAGRQSGVGVVIHLTILCVFGNIGNDQRLCVTTLCQQTISKTSGMVLNLSITFLGDSLIGPWLDRFGLIIDTFVFHLATNIYTHVHRYSSSSFWID